jgi:hypothetical protein
MKNMSIVRSFIAASLVAVALGGTAGPGASQEINPLVRERITIAPGQSERRGIRVQVGINFFLPGPTSDGEEATKIRDRARRMIYEMAGRECGVLQDTIANECRLDSVTVNLTRQTQQMPQMGQVEGFAVNGQLGFQITQK